MEVHISNTLASYSVDGQLFAETRVDPRVCGWEPGQNLPLGRATAICCARNSCLFVSL